MIREARKHIVDEREISTFDFAEGRNVKWKYGQKNYLIKGYAINSQVYFDFFDWVEDKEPVLLV